MCEQMQNMLNFNNRTMKKLLYVVVALLFAACSKEDDLTPTGLVKDWMAIQPGEGAWNEMAYEIYRDYGCSVFKNDTIGREFRGLDANGDSIIYYETLKVGYSIETYSVVDFTLCRDEAKLVEGIRMLRDLALPAMRELGSVPICYLLVDTVKSDSVTAVYGLKDFESTLVGLTVSMPDSTFKNITDFTDEEKENWVNEMKLLAIMSKLTGSYSTLIDEFYEYQEDLVEEGGAMWGNLCKWDYEFGEMSASLDMMWEYGFLNWSKCEYSDKYEDYGWEWWDITNPSQDQDLKDYIVATMDMTEAEFEEKYADYPRVLAKYRMVLNVMRQAGFVK